MLNDNGSDIPVLDKSRLEGIVKTLGDRFKLLITCFTTETDDYFSQLTLAYISKDHETMERIVHSIKSGSGNLGGKRLWEYAQTLEDDFRANHLDNAEQQISQLRDMYNQFQIELKSYIESNA